MNNIKTLYINGCSHTAGGGLHLNEVKNIYKKQYNIEYDSEADVIYGKLLAAKLNVKYINDAKAGSGAGRLVRTTWEYINKLNLAELKNTLFYLQINNPITRIDLYSAKLNNYLIVNCGFSNKKEIEWVNCTDDYMHSTNTIQYFENEEMHNVNSYLKNNHNFFNQTQTIANELAGLFSFFKLYNIKYLVDITDNFFLEYHNFTIFDDDFKKNHLINIDGHNSITSWMGKEKKQISHETNNETTDSHPGYFAHIEWADKLYNFLEKKY